MGQVVTIGLDLAKAVFQVHGIDAAGEVVVRRQIRRSHLLQFFARQPACVVGMEACASSHHWARELIALGHEVKLMPALAATPHAAATRSALPADGATVTCYPARP
jgi:transposase